MNGPTMPATPQAVFEADRPLQRPLLLSSDKIEYFSAAFFMRNPLAGGLEQDVLSIKRERFAEPAALAANWLSTAWEQHGGFFVSSPGSTTLEQIARLDRLDQLGRDHLLLRLGFAAPPGSKEKKREIGFGPRSGIPDSLSYPSEERENLLEELLSARQVAGHKLREGCGE